MSRQKRPSLFRSMSILASVMLCLPAISQDLIPGAATPTNKWSSPMQTLSMPLDSANPAYYTLRAKSLTNFYRQRRGQFIWTNPGYPSETGDSLIAIIRNSGYYGLCPQDYHLYEIEHLTQILNISADPYRIEALLTDTFLAIIKDIHFGKILNPNALTDSTAMLALQKYSVQRGLMSIIRSAEPENLIYKKLKTALTLTLDSVYTFEHDIGRKKRIQNLQVNLERSKTEPAESGRYILVNIPSFTLYVIENDSVIFSSKVIVGRTISPTPELTSAIECIITYPYWYVPRSIAVEEYLPEIKKNSTFIERQRFDVLDRNGNILNHDSIPWNTFSRRNFPVILRQRDGTDNSLGVLKFMFDNPYAIYLHDTNAKRLFTSQSRSFSHGCIRIDKAIELAQYLIATEPTSNYTDINQLLEKKTRHTISLKNPIPIRVRYYTCSNWNSIPEYHRDIYGRDSAILQHFLNATLSDNW